MVTTTSEFDSSDFELYGRIARLASKWELPQDRLDNGVVLHEVPKDTAKASTIINSARFQAKQTGYQIRATWLDNWTVKLVWYK
jgi:hypothetical protein